MINGSRGFSLIELLVALVVVSVGLLGVAGLILEGLKGDDSAYFRSQATQEAYNILDLMRANRVAAVDGDYDASIGTPISTSSNCLTSTCGQSGIAQYDLAHWKSSLASALPNGDGSVSLSTNNGLSIATVVVRWNDSAANLAAHSTLTYSTVALQAGI